MADGRDRHLTASADQSGVGATAPTVTLPKGGGAIRGIGEKFATNPVTGTAGLTIPIPASPGRLGFGPDLSLSYDSGAGNGPFGIGWALSHPAVSRKTGKGLPQYSDGDESDVFIFSDAEDLVPVLGADGRRVEDRETNPEFTIHRYRPRIEGPFVRIERWRRHSDGDIHWRSVSSDNVLSVYGRDANSRIADPDDPSRAFTWLISESRDAQGNAITYSYKSEDGLGADLAQAHQRNRGDRGDRQRTANRYLKRITYGNRLPLLDQNGRRPDFLTTDQIEGAGWMFELVLDYGEHDWDRPTPAEIRAWAHRADAFSCYRSGFEVRTARLCRRLLMFHHFDGEPGVGRDCLVRSLDLTYSDQLEPSEPRNATYTLLRAATQNGYRQRDSGYVRRSLPPLEFEYSEPKVSDRVDEVDAADLENLPAGVDEGVYRWMDLHGEGVPGILTEQADSWYYKRNLSPLGNRTVELAPLEPVAARPSAKLSDGHAEFMDLAGDGQADLVVLDSSMRGLYEHDEDEGWGSFRAFASPLNRDLRDANTKLVDVDGDGRADVLITEEGAFVWHGSRGEEGFGPAQRVDQALDEEEGPRLVFADESESVYLADLSGDGLTDLVRIRRSDISYWPNLGHGRFAAKIAMDNAPEFDEPDQFDHGRVLLADIDGSGTTDLIYLHRDGVRLYFNQSGNSWSDTHALPSFPQVDNLDTASTADLLGNGTACLVWSSPLSEAGRQLRYVDLMGGEKPHLLVRIANNLGAETHLTYAISTKFYLRDKYEGTPWINKLPFPVYVLERAETFDHVSRNHFLVRYAYHHGYFDSFEREFRGFGMVEQWDSERLGALTDSGGFPPGDNIEEHSHVPPLYTKSWFHTGSYRGHDRSSNFAGSLDGRDKGEYYREPGLDDARALALHLDDSVLPVGLTAEDEREACRALKGALLRQEIYGSDGTPAAEHPYTVTEWTHSIKCLQPRGESRHPVFSRHPRESITYHYERNPADPRLQHEMALELDEFGNVLKTVAIGYSRRGSAPELPSDADRDAQTNARITYTENEFTNAVDNLPEDPGAYRTPLPSESRTYELTGYRPTGPAERFRDTDFVEVDPDTGAVVSLCDRDIDYEKPPTNGGERRLIEDTRTLYRKDDLTGLLKLGVLEPLAFTGESYRLAFTQGLLAHVYRRNGQDLLSPNRDEVLRKGGYVSSQDRKAAGLFPATDPDHHWWIPSGRVFLSLDPDDPPTEELKHARKHFFLPRRYRDPFHTDAVGGTEGVVSYDRYDLLVAETRDALDNRVTVGERLPNGDPDPAHPGHDYRVLQPWKLMDANGNRNAVVFDALGMVVAKAQMGKPAPAPAEGDSLAGLDLDPSQTQLDAAAAAGDPRVPGLALLGLATTRIVYDLHRFRRSQQAEPDDPSSWAPAFAVTLQRESHSDVSPGETQLAISFSYSDGFGREIQKKVQAEPETGASGPGALRWVGTGWTIYNNKGKPVRQYEPFFSQLAPEQRHQFEFAPTIGVSPILFYDPLDRVVAILHPNHTYEKVVFDSWSQQTYDTNDTLRPDPSFDPADDQDVGHYFRALPSDDYLPTWYAVRTDAAMAEQEWPDEARRADEKAAAERAGEHADTPLTSHLDALGRSFLTVASNGPDPDQPGQKRLLATRIELDIEGNQHTIRDAVEPTPGQRGRVVAQYAYNMLGHRIHQASMDGGQRWALHDAAGQPIRAWDSRGHSFRTEYDPLRRPVHSYVKGVESSDPARELMTERLIYGEQHPDSAQHNMRGQLILHLDQSGLVGNDAYDFKDNLVRSSRRLAKEYKRTIDWSPVEASLPANARIPYDPSALEASLAPLLEDAAYTVRTTYDGLNRPVTSTTPHTNTMQPTIIKSEYNDAGLLERLDGNLLSASTDGEPVWTPFVTNIEYDAKGQRQRIDYGNRTSTLYEYDRFSSRLAHVVTRRNPGAFPDDCPKPPPSGWPGCQVQSLHYSYDPVGNVSRIRDDAQQAIFFRNKRVEPSTDYLYDAIYRLIEARGREHLGQAGGAPAPHSAGDGSRIGLAHPGDGKAVGTYVERYSYDAVGNLESMEHRGQDPAQAGWARSYGYAEPSFTEPGSTTGNRLSSTSLAGNTGISETYAYDEHGNTTRLPHLGGGGPEPNLHWNAQDRVRRIDLGGGGMAYYAYDAAGKRVRKVWEKSPNFIEERIYLGGFEIFRKRTSETLERETVHVMDDKQRVALVETRTADPAGDDPAPSQLIRYQVGNQLGSASLELDDRGRIISYEEYMPYGSTSYQAVRSQAETPKRFRYTAKEHDEESGLYFHGARHYAPWLGRWISCDPAELVDGPNLYQYVLSNPIRNSDPTGKQHLDQGTADDPVVMGCAGGECYMNIRQSRLQELQRRAAVQQQLDTGAAIASNPFSAIFWGIARLFSDDPNVHHAAAQAGIPVMGIAGAAAGVAAGRQQIQSVGPVEPLRPVAAEVRPATPSANPGAPPSPGAPPTPTAPPRPPPPAAPPPPVTPPPPAVPPPPAPPSSTPRAGGPASRVRVLVVGAETSAEFDYARSVTARGGAVTVVNPTASPAARSFQQSGGNFVPGRIEDLPANARFNLIREDYPFPLGRAFSPTQQFVEARLSRLTPGGTWAVVTESSEFTQALEAAGAAANARVTVNQIPLHHEATPQSSWPREQNRYIITFSR